MLKLNLGFVCIGLVFAGVVEAQKAPPVPMKDEKVLRKMSLGLVVGQCNGLSTKLMLKRSGVSTKSDFEDNKKLHYCQYIKELSANTACLNSMLCPSYEEWAKENRLLSPRMPKSMFIQELEKRNISINLRSYAALNGK